MPSSHHARADQARLIQVFWNLIRNAVKFATPGTLTIRSYDQGPDENVDGSLRLVIEFLDTGIGIEPDMLEKVFDPFEQGPVDCTSAKGGLGLGLAISRAVAQAHGGSLTVSSAGRNRGSTFRLELAAVPGPKTAPAPAPRPVPVRQQPAHLRILLVEDNVDTLRYLDLVLRKQGHHVTAASSLAAAREAMAGGEFELLISDIELPDGTGLDLIRELAPRGVPGIALSGYGSEDDIRNSHEAGFAMHLVKPVLANVLHDAICRVAKPARATRAAMCTENGEAIVNNSPLDRPDLLPPVAQAGALAKLRYYVTYSSPGSRVRRPSLIAPRCFLASKTAFLRAGGRLGRPPRRGPLACFIDQLDQPLDRVAAVRLLRPAPASVKHQEAVVANALARQADQPVANVGRQRRRAAHVEPQPDGRRHLVDVLAARPRRANELELDLVFVDRDAGIDSNHGIRDPAKTIKAHLLKTDHLHARCRSTSGKSFGEVELAGACGLGGFEVGAGPVAGFRGKRAYSRRARARSPCCWW